MNNWQKKSYMKWMLCSIIFGASSLSLEAQDASFKRLRATSLTSSINEIVLMGNNGTIDFKVPAGRRSDVVDYTGPTTLTFFRKGSLEVEGSKPEKVAQIELREDIKKPLLIFYPIESGYKVFAIEDDINQIPGGSVLFANLSLYPLTILLGENGEDRFEIKPGTTELRKFKSGNVNVRIRAASHLGNNLKKGMDSRIFPIPNFRDICFIFSDGNQSSGKVKLRTLRENVVTTQRAYTTLRQ